MSLKHILSMNVCDQLIVNAIVSCGVMSGASFQ